MVARTQLSVAASSNRLDKKIILILQKTYNYSTRHDINLNLTIWFTLGQQQSLLLKLTRGLGSPLDLGPVSHKLDEFLLSRGEHKRKPLLLVVDRNDILVLIMRNGIHI